MMRTLYLHTEPWLYRLMLVSFFLPHRLQTFIFIFFCAWVVMHAIIQGYFLSRMEIFIALVLGGGYLFYLAYIPLTEPAMRYQIFQLLERKISLFVLPFIIPLAVKLAGRNFISSLPWFVGANVLHGMAVNLAFSLTTWPYYAGTPGHVSYRIAFEAVSGIHPTYYGMYICFSIAVLLYQRDIEWPRPAVIATHLCLIFFLVLLTPKISLLIAVLLYSVYFFSGVKWKMHQKFFLFLSTLLVLLLLFFLVPFFQQRISEVLLFLSRKQSNAIENSLVLRSVIWQNNMNLLKEAWLFGMGPVKLQQNLDMAYIYLSYVSRTRMDVYNTHNEFLNQWLSFGIGGFLYFISIFLIHIRRAAFYFHQRKLYLSLILIILFTCLTENILSRQQGILFVALLLQVFYSGNIRESEK